jgi:riboflavin kinase/FMN adenylyltransferase
MRVVNSLDELAGNRQRTVVSAGNFDGVHLAHRAVLECVREDARARHARSAVLTFEPHPMRILRPQSAPRLITPLEEKIRYLQTTGIDLCVVLPFSRDLSLLQPEQFVDTVLVTGLGTISIHEGASFHFGHRQAGTVAVLEQFGRQRGFTIHLHGEMRLGRDVISSSRIRELVQAGNVSRARRLLGRCFSVRSPIAQGRGIGHKLTVPTLNLQHYEELLPARGVYVTQTVVGEQTFASVTNVGVRPTFEHASPVVVESHLLDFSPGSELEVDDVEVRFLHRLRDERKFASAELLREQIQRDIKRARRYFRAASRR